MPDAQPEHHTPHRHEDRVTIWLLALLAMATAVAITVMGTLTASALRNQSRTDERMRVSSQHIADNTAAIKADADIGIARGEANAQRIEALAYRTCIDLNALLVAAHRAERDCGKPPDSP